jgi:hypothetical protein
VRRQQCNGMRILSRASASQQTTKKKKLKIVSIKSWKWSKTVGKQSEIVDIGYHGANIGQLVKVGQSCTANTALLFRRVALWFLSWQSDRSVRSLKTYFYQLYGLKKLSNIYRAVQYLPRVENSRKTNLPKIESCWNNLDKPK